MKKFWETTNKAGKIATVIIGTAALIFILWAVWLDNSNHGKWVDLLPWLSGIGFLGGFLYLGANSGRGQR